MMLTAHEEIKDDDTVSATPSTSTCVYASMSFQEGDIVPTFEVCEDCYCIGGEILCAQKECIAPAPHCVPTTTNSSQCCPTSYECGTLVEPISTYIEHFQI